MFWFPHETFFIQWQKDKVKSKHIERQTLVLWMVEVIAKKHDRKGVITTNVTRLA
jgi:hypothetical protein